MTEIAAELQQIIADPTASLLIVGNLVLIESLLSVDNAAVLATMVMELDTLQRKKALKYGIIGAYFFRGLCLLFASMLIRIWWLKPIGGLYLIYILIDWLRKKNKQTPEAGAVKRADNWLYKTTVGALGSFWATVAMVEIMDLAFSIDNVFAAVAFSKNIILIWTGVFIGILAMRFVAQFFVNMMERYPFLETSAFAVIGLLGVKLTLSIYQHFYPVSDFSLFLDSHSAELITSGITIGIFLLPVLTSALFNFPARKK